MFSSQSELEIFIAELINVDIEDLANYQDSLLDFGIDSVQVMGLVETLQAQDIHLSFVQLAENPTLPSWWKLIQEKQKEAVS